MIALPEVDTLMAGGLSQWLDGQTQARADARAKIRKFMAIGIGGAAVVLLFTWISGIPTTISYFLAIGIFATMSFFADGVRRTMINSLKQEMNGALARALQIDYSVGAFSGSEFDRACTFALLPSYDDSYLQDQWHGEIEGTDFLLYEAKLTETRGSGKNRRTVTVFEGIVLRMQFARPFLGTTLVRREGFKFTLFGDSKTYDGQKLERIKMVDPRFEDAFDVYGSDPVEARYLVHPAYCERLLELEAQFEGERLAALFLEGDVIVTVETGNMFESATLDPSKDRERLGKTVDQFASIVKLVTLLNERPRG